MADSFKSIDILCEDHFSQKKSLGDTHSATGAYILPVSITQYYSHSCVAYRVSSLPAYAQPANDFIALIFEDTFMYFTKII